MLPQSREGKAGTFEALPPIRSISNRKNVQRQKALKREGDYTDGSFVGIRSAKEDSGSKGNK